MKTCRASLLILFCIATLSSATRAVANERYEYDDAGRVARVIYDDGSNITYTYDRNGNITSIASSSTSGIESGSDAATTLYLDLSTARSGDGINIRYHLSGGSPAQLEIVDLLGNRIDESSVSAREGSLRFDAGRLAAGVYFCRIQQGEESVVRSFVVMR